MNIIEVTEKLLGKPSTCDCVLSPAKFETVKSLISEAVKGLPVICPDRYNRSLLREYFEVFSDRVKYVDPSKYQACSVTFNTTKVGQAGSSTVHRPDNFTLHIVEVPAIFIARR